MNLFLYANDVAREQKMMVHVNKNDFARAQK